MKTLLADHPSLALAFVFLAGWLVHWVVGLLFFRQRYFEQEDRISRQSREIDELRFNLSRTQTDLRSRNDLLDAVQKSKTATEERAAALESDLATARGRIAEVEAETQTHRAAADSALGRLASTEADLLAAQSQPATATSPGPELEAALLTARAAAQQFQSRTEQLERELKSAASRAVELERAVAASQSVTTTLQSAVGARDASIAKLRAQLADKESERNSVAQALGKLDAEFELTRRARTSLEGVLKEREIRLSEMERRSQELQESFQATAQENQRLLAENQRLSALNTATTSANRSADSERAELTNRTAQLQNDLSTLRTAALATEARARSLELDLAAARKAIADEKAAATDLLESQETELKQLRSRTHHLEEELESITRANQSLTEQLADRAEPPAPPEAPATPTPPTAATAAPAIDVEALLADFDTLSRERNELAAELAVLKSSADSAPATPKSPRKSAPAAPPPPAPAPEPDEPVEEFVARCPQHLSDVKGIGSSLETRLYAAGIGSYWELSQLSDARLIEILELNETQREGFPFDSVRADAARLARETGTRGRRWNQEPPDDLEPITGIGHTFEKKLYDAGICTFDALASATVEQLREICPGSPQKRPNHASWIAQARELAAARET